jgi:peptide deformylase
MALRQIRTIGDDILNKKCKDVKEMTPRIRELISDMFDTLYDSNGVGLAAPQVGVLRRIAVIEVEEGKVYELINPKIIAFSGKQEEQEGCLSNPGEYGITKRPMHVTVRATNRNGETYDLTGEGLLARAICHECDHLDGKLYTDVQIRKA